MESRLITSTLSIHPRSLAIGATAEFALVQGETGRSLAVLASPDSGVIERFVGESTEFENQNLLLGKLNHCNMKELTKQLPWLQPKLLGLSTSAGMGDRLGIATPGHIRAIRNYQGAIEPIFAQQSIREMKRTGRSPEQVMDDALWGCFEEGWQKNAGADADHLKSKEDIDACIAAGFTFYTFDPGEYVNNITAPLNNELIDEAAKKLPIEMQAKATGLKGKTFDIEGHKVYFDEVILQQAVFKYGRAVAHLAELFEHLKREVGDHPFEVEISMDETEQPTSPAEHIYIANELRRLRIRWVSFAPRFVGRFEKGVDFIGDVQAFTDCLTVHAAIARRFGPYKLSLHSGSDKFSIYSIFMEQTRGLVHLKTAGTSYLEALRTIAAIDADLFEEIYRYAIKRFEMDRLSYHTSAQVSRAPKPDEVKDWPTILDQFDAREILHVTFGSVLTDRGDDGKLRFYDDIMFILQANREDYFTNLENHFKRHLEPFSSRVLR